MLRINWGSKRPSEKMSGWPVDGIPIKRLQGMIYWYQWGEHEFDIRVMRRVLGLPEEHSADRWFMTKKPDPCGSFQKLMIQLQEALKGRAFAEVMAEHDRLLEEASRRLVATMRAHRPVTPEDGLDDCPF